MKKKNVLLEIIIVLVVIGVLSLVTYKQFSTAQAKSRDVQRKSDLNEFASIIRNYYADYKNLPSEKLINGVWGNSFIDSGYVYADSVPKEKYGDKEYCYQIGEDGKTFKLFAQLENKNDPDCKKIEQLCNDVSYCYIDTKYAEKASEK